MHYGINIQKIVCDRSGNGNEKLDGIGANLNRVRLRPSNPITSHSKIRLNCVLTMIFMNRSRQCIASANPAVLFELTVTMVSVWYRKCILLSLNITRILSYVVKAFEAAISYCQLSSSIYLYFCNFNIFIKMIVSCYLFSVTSISLSKWLRVVIHYLVPFPPCRWQQRWLLLWLRRTLLWCWVKTRRQPRSANWSLSCRQRYKPWPASTSPR